MFWSHILQVWSSIVSITMGCFIVSLCGCICTAQGSTMQIHNTGGSIEVLFSVAPWSTAATLLESTWVPLPCCVCWGDVQSSILHGFTVAHAPSLCMWPVVPIWSRESSNEYLMLFPYFWELGNFLFHDLKTEEVWYIYIHTPICIYLYIYIGPLGYNFHS